MSGVIKEEMLKGMMCLNDVLLAKIYISPRQLQEIKPDRKYPNICHIKTTDDRWFYLKHSVLEVQAIYVNTKRQIALDKKAKGG